MTYELMPVGQVRSPLTERGTAPLQGDEGSPETELHFDARVADALRDLAPGTDVLLLTWLDRTDRDVQVVYPRGDTTRPATGVFSTRSPDRPNPIGLHRIRILAVDGLVLRVADLEALDGTPILDVKPILSTEAGLR